VRWLTSIVLATQEAEIRRIVVRSQPGQIVRETLSRRNPSPKRAGGVAQGEGPEFKSQSAKKRKNDGAWRGAKSRRPLGSWGLRVNEGREGRLPWRPPELPGGRGTRPRGQSRARALPPAPTPAPARVHGGSVTWGDLPRGPGRPGMWIAARPSSRPARRRKRRPPRRL
jgi:hypothetical protein